MIEPHRVEPDFAEPQSEAMQFCLDLCRRYARTNRPVVFVGPVGVGKTALARQTHVFSGRRGEFVALSAGELMDSLFDDVLFGHVRGAFTGAIGERRGAFQRAANGSLLLDDLAFMPRVAQAAVLRVLEDRRFTPLGAARDFPVTCREMYASTVSPSELVRTGRLLPDLESRLGEMVVAVPSLVERVEEIPSLAAGFAARFAAEQGLRRPPRLSDRALVNLTKYSWPKNLRELKGVMERAVVHAAHERAASIQPSHLPDRISSASAGRRGSGRSHRVSRELVEHVVVQSGGNQSEAARRLGIHRNTIRRLLGSDS